jgi:hypothetical protein
MGEMGEPGRRGRSLPGGGAGRGGLAEEDADLLHAPGQGATPRHRRRLLALDSISRRRLWGKWEDPKPRRGTDWSRARWIVWIGSTPFDHRSVVRRWLPRDLGHKGLVPRLFAILHLSQKLQLKKLHGFERGLVQMADVDRNDVVREF